MTKYIFVLISLLCSLYSNAQCVGEQGQVSWYYWGELPYYTIDQLFVDESFPNGPDLTRKLNSISAPDTYNDMYGSLIKGFISVPTSGPVTFNITSDDQSFFYLSTDASASNLVERALVEEWTGRDEHDKSPSQTSVPITLSANQLYYFEIQHREGGGGDHANLFWKNNFISQTEWVLVSSQYITDVCDDICPPKGTSCNDQNANTTNDIEDGNCHCVGTPNTTNACVGERGLVEVYFYNDITTGMLDELYVDPDYPTMPDQLVINSLGLQADWYNVNNNYGALIQGYLTVPVTGDYQFNLTGAMNVRFKLSSNSSPANIDNTIIETMYGTGVIQHDESSPQTSGIVSLSANTYYYYELHHASPTWGHHHSVFWKGPNHSDNNWHRIPSMYLYDYGCELACLKDGVVCDDGNPATANDQIINCDCQGTPCGGNTGVVCDDLSTLYEEFDYCEMTQELDNRADDAWLSCTASANPFLPTRSGYHWIHYDLGAKYLVHNTKVWNYNVQGQTNQGFRNVTVDYSEDGITWYNLGNYTWNLASGNSGYTGFNGPDFNGQAARYIMFTSLDNPNTCRGINKITFDIEVCPETGRECDDGVMLTVQDHYNNLCECEGVLAEDLNCQIDTLFITEEEVGSASFHAVKALVSNGEALSSSNVNYRAGMNIVLNAGFEIKGGAEFLAEIDDCGSALLFPSNSDVEKVKESENAVLKAMPKRGESLSVYALDGDKTQTVHFYIAQPGAITLSIFDHKGNEVSNIIIHDYQNYGDFYKRIQTSKLEKGVYMVRLQTKENVLSEKMIVL
jgi:hypothetical protein